MITSTANSQVKELVRLRKKSRYREEKGLFLAEGLRLVREIAPAQIERVYVSESFARKAGLAAGERGNRTVSGEYEAATAGTRGNTEEFEKVLRFAEVLSDTVFAYVADTKTPQGILAVVRRMEYSFSDILRPRGTYNSRNAQTSELKNENMGRETPPAPLIVILENLQDPGNLGTIFRTAEAAGATGILMDRDCADVYSPKVIRSAMGSAFRLPFVCTDDLPAAIAQVRAAGVRVYAAHLAASSVYDAEDYCAGTAFLIGNEGNGLTDEAAACADVRIHIPMAGEAESLNAAAAGAVLLYEASRQRRRTSI